MFNNQLVIKFPIEVPIKHQQEYVQKYLLHKAFKFEQILSKFDADSIYNKKLQQDLIIDDKKYPKGMKVHKVISKVVSYTDFVIIDNFYNQILQNNLKKGYICFSIDPIDFLTMSNNSLGWTSCHSLQGEFKAGILSLLADEATVLCYFQDADAPTFNFHGVKVNDKRWRLLAHIHPKQEFAMLNMAYPYEHEYLENYALECLYDILANGDLTMGEYSGEDIAEYLQDYIEYEEPLHYNDLTTDYNDREVKVIHHSEIPLHKLSLMMIGERVVCPVCGAKYVEHRNAIECNFCDPIEYCCTCGESHHIEDLHQIDYELYCDDCYDGEFTYCEYCDESVRRYDVEMGYHECDEMLEALAEDELEQEVVANV